MAADEYFSHMCYLDAKSDEELRQFCGELPEGPLHRISIYNDTVLHLAAHSSRPDRVDRLLDLLKMLPADRNQEFSDIKNKDGNTILHEVATGDDMKDVAEELLRRDADLLIARNELGETPIFCAARHGQTEMFKFLAGEMKLTKEGPEDCKPYLRRKDGTTVLHISTTTECFVLAWFIASSYPYLIKERDQDSMTALQYMACNPSAFIMGRFKRRREFMEDFMHLKQEDFMYPEKEYGLIEEISRQIEFHSNSDWSPQEAKKKNEERWHAYGLTCVLVNHETSWDASVDAQNPVEKASELPQEKEGKISQGSSTSEYKKSIENPLLLATISNIPDIVKAILDCHPQVLEHTNKKCEENPLFLATISNIPEIVKAILNCHPPELDHTNKSHEDPLFLAVISNIPEIVLVILFFHPQAIEHINKEGMNILHVAILYRHIEIFDLVIEDFGVLSRRLLSATDNKGNSLLHMVGQKRKSQVREKMQSPALQLRNELLLFEKVKKACKVHVTKPLNKENKTAEELFATTNEQLHKEAKEWLMRTTENCTILSVFIATVAFAAAYTVPGGFDGSTGIPILHSKPFFLVFILADVISLSLALTSVGIFFSILQSSFLLEDFKKHLFKKLIQGIICLMLSVLMMAVAFGATIILIMKHNWKNAVWHVVAFLPVPIFFLSYSPLRSTVLRTGIRGLFEKVVKSIKVVAIVVGIILRCLIKFLFHACIDLSAPVVKACENMSKAVRWICGNKSQPKPDTQSPLQPAAPDPEV